MLRRGHTLVPAETEADGYIVNTCSVTAISDKKSRQMIRRCHKLNPNAVVAACGCYVQTHPEVVAALDVDLLAGTGDRMAFLDLFEQAAHEKEPVRLLDDALRRREFEVLPAGGMAERTRAMLKVEDGCVNFCTYCIIPYARGPVRSLPMAEAEAELSYCLAASCKQKYHCKNRCRKAHLSFLFHFCLHLAVLFSLPACPVLLHILSGWKSCVLPAPHIC